MAIPVHDFPVGYGFRPTDEELISHYLRLKIDGRDQEIEMIREIDLQKHEPWDLPYLSVVESTNDQWFFFNRKDRNHEIRKKRMSLKTNKGHWKGSGEYRPIISTTQEQIGLKRTLLYYIGHIPKGKRSNWTIHEYHAADKSIDGTFRSKGDFVVCRLFKKTSRLNEVVDEIDTPVLPTYEMEGNTLDRSYIQFDPNQEQLLGDLSTPIQMQVATEWQMFSSPMQAQLPFLSNNLSVDHDFNNDQHNIPSHVSIVAGEDNLLDIISLTSNLDMEKLLEDLSTPLHSQEATEWVSSSHLSQMPSQFESSSTYNNFSDDHDFNNFLVSHMSSQFQSSSMFNNFSDDHDFNNFQHNMLSQNDIETYECLTSVHTDPEEQNHGNIRAISSVDGSSLMNMQQNPSTSDDNIHDQKRAKKY